MRYQLIIDDDERVGNGDQSTFKDVEYEVGELLRSGYFNVQAIWPVDERTYTDTPERVQNGWPK